VTRNAVFALTYLAFFALAAAYALRLAWENRQRKKRRRP
jgi:ABC-type uncharacterized transport system permease subunit